MSGALWLEQTPNGELRDPWGETISDLADRLGTPCLVYWAQRIRDNLTWLHLGVKKLSRPCSFAYALKACGHVEIAKLLERKGCWCEVMSGEEYEIARRAGFTPDRIVVNGLGWSDDFIRRIIAETPALINIDNAADFERIIRLAVELSVRPNLGVRIIPDNFDGKLFADLGSKLGVPVRGGLAANLVERLARAESVRWAGISVHALHRSADPKALEKLAAVTAAFAAEQSRRFGVTLDFLDIGGGLDDREILDRGGITPTTMLKPLSEACNALPSETRLILEPGRVLVGDAGFVLTKVRIKKCTLDVRGGLKRWLIVDAASNLLVPIPAAHFEVHAVHDTGGECYRFSVAGGICSPTSVIEEDVRLPTDVGHDTLLAIGFSGAYTLSLAENWAYTVPSVAMVDGDTVLVLLDRPSNERRFFEFVGID